MYKVLAQINIIGYWKYFRGKKYNIFVYPVDNIFMIDVSILIFLLKTWSWHKLRGVGSRREWNEEEEESVVGHSECNVQVIRNNDEINQLINDHPAMVYLNPLVALAETKVPRICSVRECEAEVDILSEVVSSAVYLRWVNHLLFLFWKYFNKK